MSDDILKLFENLTPNQVKELRARIVPALERERARILQPVKDGNIQKGEKMDNDKFNDLTVEERTEVLSEVDQAVDRILARRENTKLSGLTDEYRREMLANRGKAWVIRQIKAKYARLGVPVHSIDFS